MLQEPDTAKKNTSISETTSKSEQQKFLQLMSKDIQFLQKRVGKFKEVARSSRFKTG